MYIKDCKNRSLLTNFLDELYFLNYNVRGAHLAVLCGCEEIQGGARLVKMTFQPKRRQRSKVHGFRKRMATANGRKVLAARRKKGRKVLSA